MKFKTLFKSMTAALVSVAMALPYFSSINIAKAAPAEFQTVYRTDDFNDGNFSNAPGNLYKSKYEGEGGTINEANGKANLIRSGVDGKIELRLRANGDYPFEDTGIMKFTLSKTGDGPAYFTVYPRNFLIMKWEGEKIYIAYRQNETDGLEESDFKEMPGSYTGDAEFVISFNVPKSRFSCWINGKAVLENVYSCGEHNGEEYVLPPKVEELRLYTESGAEGDTFSIDDVQTGLPVYIPLKADLDAEWLSLALICGSDSDIVTEDINLPTQGKNGSAITWTSSDESHITTDGKVTRPDGVDSNPVVTLTATISAQNVINVKTFDITILRILNNDKDIADADAAALARKHLTSQPGKISHNITLPAKGEFGSDIVWESDSEAYITAEGVVTRPSEDEGDKTVTLKATVTKGEYVAEREFEFTVIAKRCPLDVVEILEEEDFNDGVISDKWTVSEASGAIYEENGVMNFYRPTNTGTTDMVYSFDKAYTGLIGLDFTATMTPEDEGFNIRMNGGGAYCAFGFNGIGNMNDCGRIHPDDTASWRQIGTIADTEVVDFTFLFDTEKSTYTIFENGNMVVTGRYARDGLSVTSLSQFRFYQDNTVCFGATVDDLRIYKTLPLDNERLAYDYEWLTPLVLSKEVAAGEVKNNLNLPQTAYAGSTITWYTNNAAVVSADGVVTRPTGDGATDKNVTLTAKLSYGGKNKYKTFTFKVLRYFENDEARIAADLADIEADFSRITTENINSITKSLNFAFETRYGSEVDFSSSDESVITSSGRVIRGREGTEPKNVTLTITLTSGEATVSKDFKITVLPDATFTDPQHMTDEEFFGKWEGGSWVSVGKFDYENNDKLSAIEEAVKLGDYARAKEELLTFVRGKEPVGSFTANVSDGALYRSNAQIDNIFGTPYSSFAQGEFTATGDEWQTYTAEITTGPITPGGTSTLKLMAWYNESSTLEVQSKEGGENAYIEVNVNGKPRKFYAIADATIRTGAYKSIGDSNEDILYAKTFGEFLGDDTSQILFKFDFAGLNDTDILTNARLVVNARVKDGGTSSKRVLVVKQNDSTWKEGSVAWNDLLGFYYNFNGTDGYTWDRIPGDDIEVRYQNARFYGLTPLTNCYIATRDEKYAYGAIRFMEDFILKKGDWGNMDGTGPRGQYPRTLDTAERLESFGVCLVDLSYSEYMTPDAITAIYKHIWDMGHSFTVNRSTEANWAQNEMTRLYNYSAWLNEFSESAEWKAMAEGDLIPMIYNNNFSDGSYIEGTQGYNHNAMNQFVSFKKLAESRGVEVGEDYDNMLLKAAYYNRLMVSPDGREFQWGDAGLGDATEEVYWPEIYEWYGDKEYEYITTYGESGTEPSWTSKVFFENGTTTMRSSWSRDALFMFTNVRGGGWHSNGDDNHVYVQAYGRPLLTDSGIMSYTGSTPEKNYAVATIGHNTVEVNGTSQKNPHFNPSMGTTEYIGTIDDWVTGKNIDFLSQTAITNEDADHTRTILFVKPYYFIVSDYMTPHDEEAENTYKQLWHMLPEAKLSQVEGENIFTSNFESGANVLVASVDDVTTETGDGWFDYSYNQISEIKHGYFYKKQAGDTTFDTVIAPSRNDTNATFETERLDISVDTTTATAMKLVSKADGATNTGYYYLSYEENPTAVRTFDKYTSNGQMAFVNENTDGNINIAAMKDASYIKNGSDYLVKFDRTVSDISLAMQGTELEIHTGEADITDIKISASLDFATLSVNGERVAFKSEDGYILIDKDGKVETPSDNANGGNLIGGSTGNNGEKPSGSNGGSGSGSGTTGTLTPGGVTPPAADSYFTDVEDNHWAKQPIEELYKKGIINGKAEHIYAPDANVTRAEFVSLIVRSLKVEAKAYADSFEDVDSGDWYADAIETALGLGLISKDTLFRPNDSITREEMAKIIVGASELDTKIDLPNTFVPGFADYDFISDWAVGYVTKAAYLELLKGDDAGAFNPKNNLTRAESAMVIYRFLQ